VPKACLYADQGIIQSDGMASKTTKGLSSNKAFPISPRLKAKKSFGVATQLLKELTNLLKTEMMDEQTREA
jgi:hypothetical protein